MIIRVLLIAIILILIGRFIFRFVLPIFMVTKAAQDKLNQMQQKMDEMQREQEAKNKRASRPIEGDYIDYEEVK